MRVLMVNHTGRCSGAEVALLRLIAGLSSGGCECAVACPATGLLPDRLSAAGIEHFPITGTDASVRLSPLKTSGAALNLIRSALEVGAISKRFGADVAHANGLRSGLIASLTPGARRLPLLVQSHEHLPPGRLGHAVRRVIAARSEVVVGVTNRTANNFNEGLAKPVAECLYISIDQERFRHQHSQDADLRGELGISSDAFLLAEVAQITPWKGQDVAIRALHGLEAAGAPREAHLALVGTVEFESARYDNRRYAAELRSLVRELGLADRVHFLGRRDDVPAIMRAADATMLPSWNEPFGLVAAESMGVGTPVLVSSESGVSEYLEDGVSGHLLPVGEPAAWSATIAELMRSPDRLHAMGRHGQQAVRKFSDGRYAADMRAAYLRAISSASRRR